jgi:hypothetical protein
MMLGSPIHAGSAAQLVSIQSKLPERSQEIAIWRPPTVADRVSRALIFGSSGQHFGTFEQGTSQVKARRCGYVTPSKGDGPKKRGRTE